MKYIKLDPKEVRNVEIVYLTDIEGLELKKAKCGLFRTRTKFIIEDEKGEKYNLVEKRKGIYSIETPINLFDSTTISCSIEKTAFKVDFEEEKIYPISIIKVNKGGFITSYYFDSNNENEDKSFYQNVQDILDKLVAEGKLVWMKINE